MALEFFDSFAKAGIFHPEFLPEGFSADAVGASERIENGLLEFVMTLGFVTGGLIGHLEVDCLTIWGHKAKADRVWCGSGSMFHGQQYVVFERA